MEIKKGNRLLEIDALRGIACILVVLFHYTMGRKEAELGFRLGVTGVDLFFIISGFVIFMTLGKTKSWKDFLISRFSRLYPAYWTCIIITTCFILFHRYTKNEDFSPIIHISLGNLSMLQYYFGIENLDGPYWSLIIELLFYVLMLLLFQLGQIKNITIIGSFILAFTFIYHFELKQYSPAGYDWINKNIPLVDHFPLFFAGILFYKMKSESQSILNYLLLGACFLAQYYLYEDGGRSRGSVSHTEYLFMLAIYFIFFILYCNDLLFFIVNKVTLFLGQISYSLYLIHQYLGIGFIIPRVMNSTGWNLWVIIFGIALPVAIIIASVVTFYIERPVLLLIRNKYYGKNSEILPKASA